MLYIGTSGFQYAHWNDGVFYPPHTHDLLRFYNERFNTVEINATFYNTPPPDTIERWGATLSTNSKLVLKAPRSVTHTRRLKLFSVLATDGLTLLEYFLRGCDRVPKFKRGPVLLQIHPKMRKNVERLRDVLEVFAERDLRVALEVREKSWLCDETYKALQEYNSTLVASDWKECEVSAFDTYDIGDFVYVRRHGPHKYSGDYSDEDLARDACMVRKFAFSGRETYVFFNNDAGGAAPRNALQLIELVSELGGIMPPMRL